MYIPSKPRTSVETKITLTKKITEDHLYLLVTNGEKTAAAALVI